MKIEIKSSNITFSAYKCRRPKMKRGCWDGWTYGTTLNGSPINLMFEAGYGTSFYFQWQGQWYRIPWNKYGWPIVDNLIPEDIGPHCDLTVKE